MASHGRWRERPDRPNLPDRPENHPLRLIASPTLATLAALLLATACSSSSAVVELAPETYGLTKHAANQAAAARLGVEEARAHCGAMGRAFDVVRTEIWPREYRIAFRCPRIMPDVLTPLEEDPTAVQTLPPALDTPLSVPPPAAPAGIQLY